jgi:hypothetical protein
MCTINLILTVQAVHEVEMVWRLARKSWLSAIILVLYFASLLRYTLYGKVTMGKSCLPKKNWIVSLDTLVSLKLRPARITTLLILHPL